VFNPAQIIKFITMPAKLVRLIFILTATLIMVMVLHGWDTSKTLTLHVALSGNDSWSGTLASPDKAGTNGPLRTLGQACRIIRNTTTRYEQITVLIHEGTYYVKDELLFSGTNTVRMHPSGYSPLKGTRYACRVPQGWNR
jgi:hypothetical protein